MTDYIIIFISPFLGMLLGYIVSLFPHFTKLVTSIFNYIKPIKYLLVMASVFVSMIWIIYTQLFLEYIKSIIDCENIFYLSLIENGIVNVLWFYLSINIYKKIMNISVRLVKSFNVDISQIDSKHDFNSIINSSIVAIIIFFILSKEYIYFGMFTAYLLSAIFDYNKTLKIKDINNFFIKRDNGEYYSKSTIFIELLCGILIVSHAITN